MTAKAHDNNDEGSSGDSSATLRMTARECRMTAGGGVEGEGLALETMG